jgi:hypothetical protein
MINTIVGAGAASRYGSGSDSGSNQKMRLRLCNTGLSFRPLTYANNSAIS